MKSRFAVPVLLAIFAGQGAKADPAKAQKLTFQEKVQIANAIEELTSTGTIIANPNQCVRFDPDIIQLLINEGLLKQRNSVLLSVCDGMQSH